MLLAVYIAEALPIVFAMRLRIAAAASHEGVSSPQTEDQVMRIFRKGNAHAEQAALFLSQCMPVVGSRHALNVSSAWLSPCVLKDLVEPNASLLATHQ